MEVEWSDFKCDSSQCCAGMLPFLCPNRLAVVDEVGTSGYPSKLKRPTTVWWVVLCPLVASSLSLSPQFPTHRCAASHRGARPMHFHHAISYFPSTKQKQMGFVLSVCTHAYMSKSTLGVSLVWLLRNYCACAKYVCLRFWCVDAERATCTPRREFEWMWRALRMREHIE